MTEVREREKVTRRNRLDWRNRSCLTWFVYVTPWMLAVSCGSSDMPTREPPPQATMPLSDQACTIAFESSGSTGGSTVALNGKHMDRLALAEIRTALGPPDRTDRAMSKERYEEYGPHRSSTMIDVTTEYLVYDKPGIVVRSSVSMLSSRQRILVFFADPSGFEHQVPPPLLPLGRGGCRIEFNGVVLDPTADLRPSPAQRAAGRMERFAMQFEWTALGEHGRLYTRGATPNVQIYLDGSRAGRVSYLELQ